MSYDYRVVAEPGTTLRGDDGETVALDAGVVWTGTFDDHTTRNFPAQYRGRPQAGEVRLYISNDGDEYNESDELVGVQTPPTEDEMKAFFS